MSTLLKIKNLFQFIEQRIHNITVDWNGVRDLNDILLLISLNKFVLLESDMIKSMTISTYTEFEQLLHTDENRIEIMMVLHQLKYCLSHIRILQIAIIINLEKLNHANDNIITFDEYNNDADLEPWDIFYNI